MAFKIAVVLNIAIVVLEATYGLISHSVALIADAGHNLTDVLGLLMAWGANVLAARPPTSSRTYGFRRTTILASFLNAIILLVVTGAILWESIGRLFHPVAVEASVLTWVAGVAIVLNGAAAALFAKGRKADLNRRGAFLHMASDAAVSAGVVVAGLIIQWTGWLAADPIMSIVISLVIAFGTWSLLKESFNLASDAVPERVDEKAVQFYLNSLPDIIEVHDLHIWGMSTTEAILTVHLVVQRDNPAETLVLDVCHALNHKFGIEHATIQVEREGDPVCVLAPSDVV